MTMMGTCVSSPTGPRLRAEVPCHPAASGPLWAPCPRKMGEGMSAAQRSPRGGKGLAPDTPGEGQSQGGAWAFTLVIGHHA